MPPKYAARNWRLRRRGVGRDFSAAQGSVAGCLAFGLVVNPPGPRGHALQQYMAGTALHVGEEHYAFASGRPPWSADNGSVTASGEVADEKRELVRRDLVDDWQAL